jgi:hypothetical protein
MLWDVMVAAAFVVVSVAALVCFIVKFILTWVKKRYRLLPQRRHRLIVSSLYSRLRHGLK